jgi:hypothetical protein
MGRVAQTPLAAAGLLTPAPRSAATTAHRQIRATRRAERPNLCASTVDRRGGASRPERRIRRGRGSASSHIPSPWSPPPADPDGRQRWTAAPGGRDRSKESGGERAWPLITTWCTDKRAVNNPLPGPFSYMYLTSAEMSRMDSANVRSAARPSRWPMAARSAARLKSKPARPGALDLHLVQLGIGRQPVRGDLQQELQAGVCQLVPLGLRPSVYQLLGHAGS